MKFIYSPNSLLELHHYGISIPLVDYRVKNILKFLSQKNINVDSFHTTCKESDLALAHTQAFLQSIQTVKGRRSEVKKAFELNLDKDKLCYPYDDSKPIEELCTKAMTHVYGTYLACEMALKQKTNVFHIGGGMHHAMSFQGRGFCLFNDLVLSIRMLKRNMNIDFTTWIIDVDAHKGDGTAEITQFDESIKTFSIHMKNGWPLNEGNPLTDPWFIPSDIDIALEKDESHLYLKELKKGLDQMSVLFPDKPKLALIVLGSDPYEKDSLQSSQQLNLSLNEMLERDLFIYEYLNKLNIYQVYCIGGGYGEFSHEPYLEFFNSILRT